MYGSHEGNALPFDVMLQQFQPFTITRAEAESLLRDCFYMFELHLQHYRHDTKECWVWISELVAWLVSEINPKEENLRLQNRLSLINTSIPDI